MNDKEMTDVNGTQPRANCFLKAFAISSVEATFQNIGVKLIQISTTNSDFIDTAKEESCGTQANESKFVRVQFQQTNWPEKSSMLIPFLFHHWWLQLKTRSIGKKLM
ncbi:hypothetical protein NPIL_155271 [Nephila pilipes]|uniref:Uncharacterized protein n=1 Tax=Nephila pilipes TaxID=299642 RepID=A0A8X6MXM7_NEPPI|nr:hypothetical protein NPIL_155271 [Nephila pilipes]